MKPPRFAYHAPASLDEALATLAELGPDAKVLAGGQSLVPILNMRLVAPRHLVDINRLGELGYVRTTGDGVQVGALARHAEVEADDHAAERVPLLRQGLRLVAHPTIRNRGTTVGSLTHADPSGEMTAVLALLGGSVELARQGARRIVPAADFFLGPLESAVAPGELAVSAWFPALPPRSGTAFVEVARRHGDYALCGVVAAVTLDEGGAVAAARAAYLSVSPVPLVLDLTPAVAGQNPRDADWSDAVALARDGVDPEADIHATAEYRRHLAGVLTGRALAEATTHATIGATG